MGRLMQASALPGSFAGKSYAAGLPAQAQLTRRLLLVLLAGLLATGLQSATRAGWIATKAELAQVLLNRAWERSKALSQPVKPWAWADTHPVARLTVARLNETHIVLNAGNGEAMAFGPAAVTLPGKHSPAFIATQPGTGPIIIGGHRDTHLKFVRELRHGDLIRVENVEGEEFFFQTESVMIVDSSKEQLHADMDADGLVLITCYPFDAVEAGGPLRAVVVARVVEKR